MNVDLIPLPTLGKLYRTGRTLFLWSVPWRHGDEHIDQPNHVLVSLVRGDVFTVLQHDFYGCSTPGHVPHVNIKVVSVKGIGWITYTDGSVREVGEGDGSLGSR